VVSQLGDPVKRATPVLARLPQPTLANRCKHVQFRGASHYALRHRRHHRHEEAIMAKEQRSTKEKRKPKKEPAPKKPAGSK